MRTTLPPTSKIDRLPRLIVWATAMIIWAASAFLGERRTNRRHIRQRYGALNINKLAHLVRNLMIIRAAHFLRPRTQSTRRQFASTGFRHSRGASSLRAIAGSRLRRFLNQGDLATRLTRFVQIVRNLDAYAREFLLRRAKNGVNRLAPLLALRPPHEPASSLTTRTPLLADSS